MAEEHDVAVAEPKDVSESKDAPALTVNPGDSTLLTATLAATLSALYVTNTAPSPPTTATWVFPGTLQVVYGDWSMITIRFEALQYAPSVIRTY